MKNLFETFDTLSELWDNTLTESDNSKLLNESPEVDKNSALATKVMWIVANNKDFYKQLYTDLDAPEFKKLKKDIYSKVKSKFSCSTKDAEELIIKGASLYKKMYM